MIIPVTSKHQQEMKGLKVIDTMLFIPSLTNLPVNEYKRFDIPDGQTITDVVRQHFTRNNGIEIYFKWDRHCFTTVSIINLLLVQLFTQDDWNIDLSKDAKIYKEKLENRKPGIVSLIEFDPDLILVEEENLGDNAFYTIRTIRIFAMDSILKKFQFKEMEGLREIFRKSVRRSENKIASMLHIDALDITFSHDVRTVVDVLLIVLFQFLTC